MAMHKLAALTIAVVSLGCRGVDAPPAAVATGPFVISTPHPDSLLAKLSEGRGDIAWVALPAGSIPNAGAVSINAASFNQTITARASDGGLDPVPVAAELGDELRLTVTGASGDVTSYDISIRGSKGPIVIRTAPAPKKRDVPLNATIIIVFSEPLSPTSLTAEAVTLTSGSAPVAGSLSFADATHLVAVLRPAAALTPSTDYTLTISQHITNVDGQPLRVPVVVPFTTTDSPTPPVGTFTVVGNPIVSRVGHTATLLPDGKVLIAGGGTASAELFDPSTNTFMLTGSMMRPRTYHTATMLPNGQVLITGGEVDSASDVAPPGGTAELYDPATGKFSPTGVMLRMQYRAVATLLANGEVMITGGQAGWADCCTIDTLPELYDPVTGLFSLAALYADSSTFRFYGLIGSSATLLHDGRVLIASEPDAELYDPVSNRFSLTGPMQVSVGHPDGWALDIPGRSATLLRDGQVLVVGGNQVNLGIVAGAELYDASRGAFSYTGSMSEARFEHTATLLEDGRVLVAGGGVPLCGKGCGLVSTASTEVYDPATGQFAAAAALNFARQQHTATLLKDGSVLIVGGYFLETSEHYTTTPVLQAERYVPDDGRAGGGQSSSSKQRKP